MNHFASSGGDPNLSFWAPDPRGGLLLVPWAQIVLACGKSWGTDFSGSKECREPKRLKPPDVLRDHDKCDRSPPPSGRDFSEGRQPPSDQVSKYW